MCTEFDWCFLQHKPPGITTTSIANFYFSHITRFELQVGQIFPLHAWSKHFHPEWHPWFPRQPFRYRTVSLQPAPREILFHYETKTRGCNTRVELFCLDITNRLFSLFVSGFIYPVSVTSTTEKKKKNKAFLLLKLVACSGLLVPPNSWMVETAPQPWCFFSPYSFSPQYFYSLSSPCSSTASFLALSETILYLWASFSLQRFELSLYLCDMGPALHRALDVGTNQHPAPTFILLTFNSFLSKTKCPICLGFFCLPLDTRMHSQSTQEWQPQPLSPECSA